MSTLFDSSNLKKVDSSNVREVVSATSMIAGNIKETKYEEAIAKFRLGCLYAEYQKSPGDNKLTIREFAQVAGINYQALSKIKTVANQFHLSEKEFKKKYKELNSTSWDSFLKRYYPRERKLKKFTKKQEDGIRNLLSDYKNGIRDDETYETLKYLRDEINKFIPMGAEITDRNLIQYGNCCGCGEQSPPNGWEIYADDMFTYIKYPLCPNCKEPDYKLVAELYARYAINLEAVYDKLL